MRICIQRSLNPVVPVLLINPNFPIRATANCWNRKGLMPNGFSTMSNAVQQLSNLDHHSQKSLHKHSEDPSLSAVESQLCSVAIFLVSLAGERKPPKLKWYPRTFLNWSSHNAPPRAPIRSDLIDPRRFSESSELEHTKLFFPIGCLFFFAKLLMIQ